MPRPDPPSYPLRSSAASRRTRAVRTAFVVLAVLILAGGIPAARWLLTKRSLAWQARRGLQLLDGADSPWKVRAALDRWERETEAAWRMRTDEFVRHLYRDYPLEDQRVRLLLTRVCGADFGPDREQWQRWYQARERLRAGQPPRASRREAVTLRPLWTAPVGQTAWFSTILPLDGQVYVASLGSDFTDSEDTADGVVCVDGRAGSSELWFVPPGQHRGPRDVIGVAAGDRALFVACYNGSVYDVDLEGRAQWHVHVGDPIVAPPLSADVNRDGVTDVLVVTRAGKVIALSGRQGRTIWVANVGRSSPGDSVLGATLALGNPLPSNEPEAVVTLPNGEVDVLALRSGRSLWRQLLGAGTLAGAVCQSASGGDAGPFVYLGDRSACVWSLARDNRALTAVPWQVLAVRQDETLAAALRSLGVEAAQPPLLVACVTSGYMEQRGAVCVISPQTVRWRWPVDGAIWGTPAVADLNGDRSAEIVVGVVVPVATDRAGGALMVFSQSGVCVAHVALDAPVECSPVVADVNGDHLLDVLVADQSGVLHCFGTDGYGPVEWGLFGGDSHNTRDATNAYAFGQSFFGQQWQWKPEEGADPDRRKAGGKK